MYGHRARIGYCSPPFVTEVFPYEFYKMVPDGVTLMITTLEVGNEYTKQAFDGSYDRSLAAARAMGAAGADVVVLGGNPVNQSRGIENLPKICDDLAREVGHQGGRLDARPEGGDGEARREEGRDRAHGGPRPRRAPSPADAQHGGRIGAA